MARLYDYRLELLRTHPGSTIVSSVIRVCSSHVHLSGYIERGFPGRVQADSFLRWVLFERLVWGTTSGSSWDRCK